MLTLKFQCFLHHYDVTIYVLALLTAFCCQIELVVGRTRSAVTLYSGNGEI